MHEFLTTGRSMNARRLYGGNPGHQHCLITHIGNASRFLEYPSHSKFIVRFVASMGRCLQTDRTQDGGVVCRQDHIGVVRRISKDD